MRDRQPAGTRLTLFSGSFPLSSHSSIGRDVAALSRKAVSHRSRIAAFLVATALAPAALPLIPDHGWMPGISQARAAENVTIDKIEVTTKTGVVILSGLAITGSSLGKADIDGLLRSTTISGLSDRLQKLDADKIAIGSIEWRHKSGGQDMTTIYEGIEGTGVKAGAIGSVAMKGGRQTGTIMADGKPRASEVTFGRFTLEKLDLAGIFRWYSESDPTGSAPMKQLHGSYQLESMDLKMDNGSFHFGRVHVSGFKARLAKKAPIDLIPLVDANSAKPGDKLTGLKLAAGFLDLFSSVEVGEGGIDGIRFTGKDKTSDTEVTGTIGKITFAGGAGSNFAINDLDVKAKDGFFRMKKTAFAGDSYGLMLMGLERAFAAEPVAAKAPPPPKPASSTNPASSANKVFGKASGTLGKSEAAPQVDTAKAADTAREEAELRKAITEAAAKVAIKDVSLKLEGIDADFPPGKESKSKERVKFGLASFETNMGGFVGVTPTRIDYQLNNFKMQVPTDSKDPSLQTLRSIGIDVIDLSARVKGTWDEGKTRFVVDDIMTNLDKFARIGLRAELGNIPRPLFENPQQNWSIALMSGNIQSIGFAIENQGGIEKLIAKTASDQGKSPEQLKMEFSAIAPAVLGAYMGGHPDGPALVDAITQFIRKPGSLSVTVKAANLSGITMMDASAASSNPAALLQKLKIEAVAK